ncbi:MAG: serine/threonine-protein kinase [Rudaea sp.]
MAPHPAVMASAFSRWTQGNTGSELSSSVKNASEGNQHPNIVAIYEVGSAEELHYFSMRLVPGGSLAGLLKREGKLAPTRAAKLLRTVAEAVDYAHRLGVLHLDLKPANVLIDDAGVPHVADFGLARRFDQGLATDNYEVSGTPSYMAPEQCVAGSQRITPATDIWGLGAIGYELVTGHPPYLGNSPHATIKLVVDGELGSPRKHAPQLPRDLEAIIRKCMDKDVARRYSTARELADDLTRYLEHREVRARPLNAMQRTWRWARREPKFAIAAVFALTALLAGLAATTAQWRRANANAQHAETERKLAMDNAAVSSERLWDGRRNAALRMMDDGNGFEALAPLIANIEEKKVAGKTVEVERREIGMIEQQGVTLIDRFIIADANPMATALSPDGSLLAVTLNNLSVRWYDTATLTERGRVDLLDYLDAVAVPVLPRFINDHRLLVFGEWFGFLPNPGTSGGVLIDLDKARAVSPPAAFADFADITWSADGHHALLHDTHDRVQLWQTEPWRPLSALTPELVMNGLRHWVLDPQLRYAAQFGRNMNELRLFDPHRLDAPRVVPLPPHESFSAWAASRNGTLLALGTGDGQIIVVDMHSLAARQFPGPLGSRVNWLSFSEDDAWLAAAHNDGAAFAYDVASGKPLHAGQMQVDFDPTHVDIEHHSRLLILSGQIAGSGGDAQVWHLPQESPMPGVATHLVASPPRSANAGPYWLSAAPRAGLLASAGMDGEIRLWRLPTATTMDAQPPLIASENLYTDGDRIVDVDYDRLRVASTAKRTATSWLSLPPPIAFAEMVDHGKTLVVVARTGLHVLDTDPLRAHIPIIALRDTPQHIAVSADGRLAALSFDHNAPSGFEERIELYDLVDGKRLDRGGVAVKGPLRQFTLSADATHLLTTGPVDGVTEVFDTRTLKSLGAYPNDPAQPVILAAFTADAQRLWLVTRNIDDTQADNADLILWNLRAGKIVEKRHVPGVYPIGIAVLGDKPLLAGRDRLVLDPGTPDEHSVTGLRGGEATTVFAVSHDGRLAAHAFDQHVQIYDASDLTPIGPALEAQGSQMNTVTTLAFSDNDRHLLAFVHPSISSPWRRWPVATSWRSFAQLRADAALLAPRDAGPRVLHMASANERARLRAADPGPPPAPESRPLPAVARWIGRNPIPARDPAAGPLQIDLGGIYNLAPTSLNNSMNSVMPALADMPLGLARLNGIDYDLRGAVEMRRESGGNIVDSRYRLAPRGAIRDLRVPPQRIAALHVLLYAPQSLVESRERLYATVRLHYRDGSQAVVPIRTQREVKGWTDHDRPTPIGWVQGAMMRVLGVMRQSVVFNNPRLPNPHPEKIVVSLDLETAPSRWSTPVFFAITAEPVIATGNSRLQAMGTTKRALTTDGASP